MQQKHLLTITLLATSIISLWLITISGVPSALEASPTDPTYDCAAQTDIPQSECEALVAIYNETDGPNWIQQTGWLAADNPCDWYGVTCSTGHVTILNLSGSFFFSQGLTGGIPAEIGNLASLEELYLSWNYLTSLPPEISNLTNLTALDLAINQLTTLPSEIGELANLSILFLSFNQLTALPAEIGNLTSLTNLALFGNQLTTLPAEIGNLTNLIDLSLHINQLTTLPISIGNLTSLQVLTLFRNQLTAIPSEIGNLSGLTHIDLHYNQLTQIPMEIGNLTDLTYLNLYHNPLNGEIPVSLTSLNLLELYFYETNWCTPETPNAVQLWLDSIPTVYGTGRICGQPGGSISGQVSINHMESVTQTTITLYGKSWDWFMSGWVRGGDVRVTHPDAQGNYHFDELGQGIDYFIHFNPPPGSGLAPQYHNGQDTLNAATPITVTLGMTTSVNVTLSTAQPAVAVITSTTGVINTNPTDGTLIVTQRNGRASDLTVTDTILCADGSVPSSVTLTLGDNEYPMSGTGNLNEYSATIPAHEVSNGTLQITAVCNGNDENTTIGTVTLYDPSGFITDSVTTEPIVGATVALYQVPGWQAKTSPQDDRPDTCQSNNSKVEGEAWNQPAPTELGMLVNTDVTTVAPLINQQTTDNEGYYGWDVPAGCWYVTVTADGYESLTSPVVGVPTEVTDLDLQLTPLVTTRFIYLPLIVR